MSEQESCAPGTAGSDSGCVGTLQIWYDDPTFLEGYTGRFISGADRKQITLFLPCVILGERFIRAMTA
ncbi:hypothetical protein [Sphingobium yanoikuyae]|uniref:hypothetical protein n=1 Tax=Sphingobium yanoikuyae TaxID=13690 RepID=UPI0035AE7E96